MVLSMRELRSIGCHGLLVYYCTLKLADISLVIVVITTDTHDEQLTHLSTNVYY